MFSEHCQVTFDYVTFVNNTAETSGGAIESESSIIDIHNCKAEDNIAEKRGHFAMLRSKSKLKTNYLTLFDIKRNSIVISESSSAELRHVHLANGSYFCSISALINSNINLRSIYSERILTNEVLMNSYNRKHVCPDETSSVEGTLTGIFSIKYLPIFFILLLQI